MEETVNPWSIKFICPSDDEIDSRIKVIPQKLTDLRRLSNEVAGAKLESSIKELFLPSVQIRELLKDILAQALIHAQNAYPTKEAFNENVYDRLKLQAPRAMCLSGPAGIGKTQLINAFQRLVGGEHRVTLANEVTDTPIVPSIALQMRSDKREGDVYEELTKNLRGGRLGTLNGRKVSHEECSKKIYRAGVCTLFLDEMQFGTLSSEANAQVTKTLLGVASLGPPLVYAANFSLLHRLKRRPQEDQDRLLPRIKEMQIDGANSQCWAAYVNALLEVAEEYVQPDWTEFAGDLHRFTGGNRRYGRYLIGFAYSIARKNGRFLISKADLQLAYEGKEYGSSRNAVEHAMSQSLVTKISTRPDLISPIKGRSPQMSERTVGASQEIAMAASKLVMHAVHSSSSSHTPNNVNTQIPIKGPIAKPLVAEANRQQASSSSSENFTKLMNQAQREKK